jgi:hypothetical protein
MATTQKEKEFSTSKTALDDREAALAEKEKERSAELNKKMEELKDLQNSSAAPKKSDTSTTSGRGSLRRR